MRTLWILAAVAPAALVAACADSYQVDQTASTSPTVSYSYAAETDYDRVAKRANLHCEDNYGRDAVLVDRARQDSGYEATFRCR